MDAEWTSYVRSVMEQHQIPGAVLASARGGEPLYEGSFGFRDRERNVPATMDTVFGIASITKSFTALAIMQLQDAGKLKVSDPVTRWIPELRVPHAAQIALHHLLTHSAGMPPLPTLWHASARSLRRESTIGEFPPPLPLEELEPVDTWEDLVRFINNLGYTPLGEPGKHFSYSNDSWALLGGVIERVSGLPYQEYMRERIFRPLGLENTTLDIDEAEGRPTLSQFYIAKEVAGQKVVAPSPGYRRFTALQAGGMIISTAGDLIKYLEVYRKGGAGFVSAAAVQQMLAPHIRSGPNTFYGYGLQVQPGHHGVTLIGHSGGWKGVASHAMLVPEAGLTAVALTNLYEVPAAQLALDLCHREMGIPLGTRRFDPPAYAATAAQLERLAGTYLSGEGARLRFFLENETLMVQVDNNQPRATRPYAADAVLLGDVAGRFLSDAAGRISAVAWGSRIIRRV